MTVTRSPLLLRVPGYASGPLQFLPFKIWLDRQGLASEDWARAPVLYHDSVQSHIDELAEDIIRHPAERIIPLGWSMGGIISVGAMAYPEVAAKVPQVLSFATPYDGTTAAYLGTLADLLGLHIRELLPGSSTLRRIRRIMNDPRRRWRFHAINGRHDLLAGWPQKAVPPEARIDGPWNHLSLLYDTDLFRLIHSLIVAA